MLVPKRLLAEDDYGQRLNENLLGVLSGEFFREFARIPHSSVFRAGSITTACASLHTALGLLSRATVAICAFLRCSAQEYPSCSERRTGQDASVSTHRFQ